MAIITTILREQDNDPLGSFILVCDYYKEINISNF